MARSRGVILVFHDVTETRARERALREAEWRARTALEVAGGGAWMMEVETRTWSTGDALLARDFGVPLERCRAGEPIASFLPRSMKKIGHGCEAAIAALDADGRAL